MKKIITTLSLFSFAFATAQQLEKIEKKEIKSLEERKHEVKIGAIKLLSGGIVEGTYEYINSKDFTFGSSILLNFDNSNDYPEDFSITPFARFYFTESKEYGAKGFFVEGFGKYVNGKSNYTETYFDTDGNYINNTYYKKYNTASLGLSLGKKWVNNSGFVFEALIGVGRNIAKSNNTPDASFRGDLNIGYRF